MLSLRPLQRNPGPISGLFAMPPRDELSARLGHDGFFGAASRAQRDEKPTIIAESSVDAVSAVSKGGRKAVESLQQGFGYPVCRQPCIIRKSQARQAIKPAIGCVRSFRAASCDVQGFPVAPRPLWNGTIWRRGVSGFLRPSGTAGCRSHRRISAYHEKNIDMNI